MSEHLAVAAFGAYVIAVAVWMWGWRKALVITALCLTVRFLLP